MYTIIGLGNPGDKYRGTRHNVGFMACDYLAHEWQAGKFDFDKYANAEIARASVGGGEVSLVKPQTFMNRSGETAKFLVDDKQLDLAKELLVVHDDVDLPLGTCRLAYNRGTGGHRGVRSVIDQLGTKEITRLRVGISPTDESGDVQKQKTEHGINPFVMGRFTEEERAQLDDVFSTIEKITTTWITDGKQAAMDKFNS